MENRGTTSPRDLLGKSRRSFSWGSSLNRDRVMAALEVAGSPTLDIGCSGGGLVQALREAGIEVFGMDILLPERLSLWNGGGFLLADVLSSPFRPSSFHTVCCFEVLEHLHDPAQGLREIARITQQYLVLSVPDATRRPEHELSGYTYHHWLDRTHVSAFTAESLTEILERTGFQVQAMRGINRLTPEVLVLAQYPLGKRARGLLLRVLRKLPGRRERTMTILVIAKKVQPR